MSVELLGLALAIGVALAIQAAVNGHLAVALGDNTIAAGLVSFATGTIAIGAAAALRAGSIGALVAAVRQPPWTLTGGALGAAALLATTFLAPRIGLANLLALVIAGQLLTSLTIDHYGLLGRAIQPVSVIKLGGTALMLGGVALALFGDGLVETWRR